MMRIGSRENILERVRGRDSHDDSDQARARYHRFAHPKDSESSSVKEDTAEVSSISVSVRLTGPVIYRRTELIKEVRTEISRARKIAAIVVTIVESVIILAALVVWIWHVRS
jgi:hypothetical protein